MSTRITRQTITGVLLAVAAAASLSAQGTKGAVYTTTSDGTVVNANTYASSTDVYVSGGPQNTKSAGLADGTYYFQVTDPSGATVLSTDAVNCRQLTVSGGRVTGAAGPCPHATGTFNAANGVTPVQLSPFSQTPNAGGVYKVWLSTSSDFAHASSKTDNFKVQQIVVQQGSCQPSSSLSVLVSGTNVVAYVPKGSWAGGSTGVSAVNVEGASVVPTLIPTTNVVNSCASNPTTGTTVCTANTSDVYLISGTALGSTLSSSGSGLISFSGGVCTNCGVAMDAFHNQALIGLSVAGAPGFQLLDLTTSTFHSAFASASGNISEDPLIDPTRSTSGGPGALVLSAAENNTYEIVDVTVPATPASFENAISVLGTIYGLDSSAEDCSTGIALATVEETDIAPTSSRVYLADLTQATFTAGAPGTWSTAAQQLQTLSEARLTFGAAGIAVAQGTHTGVVTGEFGGDTLTAVALPATSGSGTPAIGDWVTCAIGNGFVQGFDPHTLTAYQSPNGNDAIAVLANAGAATLAVVDLTKMLNPTIVPRTLGGHGCASGTLPATVVSFIAVP